MNPLESIYYALYRLDISRKLKRQKRLPLPVISIGNITTGGTGKTPHTLALALEAVNRDIRPCVLTRGYGGSIKGPVVVSSDHKASEVGDEPLLMAEGLEGRGHVVKCADRYKGGVFAIENITPAPELFILDDGFQRRDLYRDVDIVLISATDPFGGEKLIPSGRLREPLGQLRRASAIVITRADSVSADELVSLMQRLGNLNPAADIFTSAYTATGKIASSIKGKKVFVLCAIAEPMAFEATLRGLGAEVVGRRYLRDHAGFSAADLSAAIASEADWIMTTEKDIMRLRAMEDSLPDNLAALPVEVSIQPEFYKLVFQRIGRDSA